MVYPKLNVHKFLFYYVSSRLLYQQIIFIESYFSNLKLNPQCSSFENIFLELEIARLLRIILIKELITILFSGSNDMPFCTTFAQFLYTLFPHFSSLSATISS